MRLFRKTFMEGFAIGESDGLHDSSFPLPQPKAAYAVTENWNVPDSFHMRTVAWRLPTAD